MVIIRFNLLYECLKSLRIVVKKLGLFFFVQKTKNEEAKFRFMFRKIVIWGYGVYEVVLIRFYW